MIVEVENELTTASRAGVFGRFQCETAIQSVHVQRPVTGRTHHEALATLYGLLADRFPSVGVLVAQASAMVEGGEHLHAIAVLERLVPAEVRGYQPYWVTLANARRGAGQSTLAEQALQTAIGLSEDPAVRRFLEASRQGRP